jgi:Sulfotransferase domain
MLLFCDGMPRSASTWAYNVAFALLKTAFPNADIRRSLENGSHPAPEIVESRANWEIMKCHRLGEYAHGVFRSGYARSFYTHRDFYDAIASYLVMFRVSFDLALQTMIDSLDVYDFHCETGNFLCVSYESIIERPAETIRTMAEYLGLDLPESAIGLINEAHSFHAIKELSANLKQAEGVKLVRNYISCYDQETQWHVRHVRNGGIGYGRKYLLPQQIAQIGNLIRSRKGPSRDLLPVVSDTPAAAGAAR